MNDLARRVNSIVIKNLPTEYTENELEELFSNFGRILSSKVLPSNPNVDGSCAFVNYAEADSCTKAVESMNNHQIDRFTLCVQHSSSRMNGFRNGGEINNENKTVTPSPTANQTRFSGFQSASTRSSVCGTPSKLTELDKPSNIEQSNIKSPFQIESTLTIREHSSFVTNKTYCVYLSNLEVPKTLFAATLDDYVNATLLITQMNKHEQLVKTQADTLKSKFVVGQFCAALFNGDWYRARILEIDDSKKTRVEYVDWGNTNWCDSVLEIRPLPTEFYKDPILCVKCLLDGISNNEKLSDKQMNSILEILVLDVKLEMTVVRFENQIPYIQLNLGERNLNNEINTILSSSTIEQPPLLTFDSHRPQLDFSHTYFAQITTVDFEPECFHVLLMQDCLPTIMNVLKDWNENQQPLIKSPQANTLVCAQYEMDDLWYRAWIENVTDRGFQVYFVDFGNEEIVSSNRLSECPANLQTIPWQSIQIKLANIQLTDEERQFLLHHYENERLEMKICSMNQNLYLVELFQQGKSLTDRILESRKAKERSQPKVESVPLPPPQPTPPPPPLPVLPTPPPPTIVTEKFHSAHSAFSETKRSVELTNSTKPVPVAIKPNNPPVVNNISTTSKSSISNDDKTDNTVLNDNLTTMITEQRRQNRLLEQVIAAVNTTNALLNQLVQR